MSVCTNIRSPDGKKSLGNSPENGTRLATALRKPPFSACKKGIEDVCSLHASYDGDCYRLFSIIVHCRAQLQKEDAEKHSCRDDVKNFL